MLEYIFSMHVKHHPSLSDLTIQASTADLKNAEGFGRVVYPVTGGTFCGPDVRGTICEHGAADRVFRTPDGKTKLDVRLTLKTDGEFIYVSYNGLVTKQGITATPSFETNAPQYAWLNTVVCVAIGKGGNGVMHDLYAVKQVLEPEDLPSGATKMLGLPKV